MRVLIDTNVVILSEDNAILTEQIQDLHTLSKQYGISLCAHEKTKTDLLNDKDEARRKIILAKVGKYPLLGFQEMPDSDFFAALGSTSSPGENSFIDDCILFALYRHATAFLVSEDKGLLSKARRIGLADRAFNVSEFNEFVRQQFEHSTPLLPSIHEVEISQLKIESPIFDSLKQDYPGFVDWFNKKAESGRKAWTMHFGDELIAVCIFDPSNAGCDGAMKLCTFKVADSFQGKKVGEHLLKQAIVFAVENEIDQIRVEVFSDKTRLIYWLEDFGFYQIDSRVNGSRQELVFRKDVTPIITDGSDPLELAVKHFPYLPEPPLVDSFIVPIQPDYSTALFPELVPQGQLWLSACGQAIKKAYVCHAKIKKIKKGDLLLFYESDARRSIFARGVVDDVIRSSDQIELETFIGKRSVYSPEDIRAMLSHGELLVLKFYHSCLPMNEVPFADLKSHGILVGPPQSIVQLTQEEYDSLKVLL